MKLLWLIILAISLSQLQAFGAITRTGSCYAATTSCTLSAVNTGDLILVWAYRNASTTAPGLPASNTNVFASSAGTTNSLRVYCRVASSGADTGTGTSTSASGIGAVAYSGTAATTTANCANQGVALGVVANANANTAVTTTTVTWSGLTTSSGTTSSWIVGGMGSTTTQCTPTGLTVVGTPAGSVRISDSNATKSSWASITCSITSGTYRDYIVEILASDSGVGSGTPALVQLANDADWPFAVYVGSGVTAGGFFKTYFSNAVRAGDLLTLMTASDSATAPSVTDDGGNSWFLAKSCTDTTNTETTYLFYAPNASANTKAVTTTQNGQNNVGPLPIIAEWTNAALSNAVDVTTCNFANSTSVTAGSVTPTVTSDLALQYSWNEWLSGFTTGGAKGVHYTAGSQSNISWEKIADGWTWAVGAQWGVYASTSAINPTMTVSTSGFNSIAAFFKRSSSGSAVPTGIRVTARHQVPIFASNHTGLTDNPITTYAPCPSGTNLRIADWSGPNNDVTAISDSQSNSWSSNHAKACSTDGLGAVTCVHNYSASNASVAAGMTTTITYTSGMDDSVILYCVAGASPSAFDLAATASGDQTVAGNQTMTLISPSTSNGLITFNSSESFNTTNGFTTGQNFTGCLVSNQNIDVDGCAANNGWGVYYNPNTSGNTWTSTFQSGSEAIRGWIAESDAYKAPGSCSNLISLLGLGCQ